MIFRNKHEVNYTVLSNQTLSDKTLSFKARGLLAFMLSKPTDWEFFITEIITNSDKDGAGSVRAGIKELIAAGYLTCKQPKTKHGRWGKSIWDVWERPHTENPHTENPHTENPHTENPHTENPHTENYILLNTDIQSTKSTKKDFLRKDKFDPSDLPFHFSRFDNLAKAWAEFIQHRKEKKCPLTPLAYQKIVRAMLPHSPEVIIAAINKSISCGWRGLFLPDASSPCVISTIPKGALALRYEDMMELGRDTNRPIPAPVAKQLAMQVQRYWDALHEIRNPRNENQGPTDVLPLRKFWSDWLRYLLELQPRFPFRTPDDLAVGRQRWNQYIERCEKWTGYDFKTGKRKE